MITITPEAAQQILTSLPKDDPNSVLRVAVKQGSDGTFQYLMGLDEAKPEDTQVVSNDVRIVLSSNQVPLMQGMEIDFVELNPGEHSFIFKNPNDPMHKAGEK